MQEKSFENELRAHNAAEMIGGKLTVTEDGHCIESTLGGLIKYNLSRGFSLNLNTHCALVALCTPMFDNELEIRIRFVEKHHVDWQVNRMKREIADELGEDGDMNGEADILVRDIMELMQSDREVWLNIDKDAGKIDLDGWFHIVSHHHVVKVEPPCPF